MDKRLEKKWKSYRLMRGNLTPKERQKELVNIEAFQSLLQIERALIREIDDTDSPIGQAIQEAVIHLLFFNGVEDLGELVGRLDCLENDIEDLRDQVSSVSGNVSSTEHNLNHATEYYDRAIFSLRQDIEEIRNLIKGKRGR